MFAIIYFSTLGSIMIFHLFYVFYILYCNLKQKNTKIKIIKNENYEPIAYRLRSRNKK